MRHIRFMSSSLLLCSLVLTGPAVAQQSGISSGVVAIAPGVTVNVLRESSVNGPVDCSHLPRPMECDLTNSQAWLGSQPTSPIGMDAAGSAYNIANVGNSLSLGDGDGTFLQRTTRGATTENVVSLYRQRCLDPPTCSLVTYYSRFTPFFMDVTNGRILIVSGADIRTEPGEVPVDYRIGLLEISGLPPLLDTLLTYIPGGQLTALVPAHPDGFRSADSLQVWTGNVRSMPDWSQAQPLACMAAQNPIPGQIVSVADALSDPPVGQGRYYLVASQSGADRRLGRQYVNGVFSARQPAGLPVCQ